MTAYLDALVERDVRLNAEHDYAGYHAKRFQHLLGTARRVAPGAHRVLDVGRGVFTTMAASVFAEVWSLGFPEPGVDRHIVYDFNDLHHGRLPQTEARFDLIVFSEVVEHLHVPASAALVALKGLLAPGGLILLQTPNAAEVMKRVALLRGHNPYERLRMTPFNPGHFREYTLAELREEAGLAGLRVIEAEYRDDLPHAPPPGFHPIRFLLDQARKVRPAFRSGITLVLSAA